ncbi:MAG: PKD domain-containing protein [Gammaproteobacteria bacterium]
MVRTDSLGMLVAGFFLVVAGAAPAQESQTLGPGAEGPVSYESGPFLLPNESALIGNTGGRVCDDGANPCGIHLLDVIITPEYLVENPNPLVQVDLRWDPLVADMDLYVYTRNEENGLVQVASSGNEPGFPESLSFSARSGGRYEIRVVPYSGGVESAVTTALLIKGPEETGELPSCNFTGAPTPQTRLSPGLARDLKTRDPASLYGAFVHFSMGSIAEQDRLLAGYGLRVQQDFRRYSTGVYAVGPVSGFRAAAAHDWVSFMEENRLYQFMGETAAWASRIRPLQEQVSGGPYRDVNGNVLDGKDVTVAVLDSGLNAAHPDFAGRVVHNFKITGDFNGLTGPSTFVDLGYGDSDLTSGHGTHVTGTVGGSGASSVPQYLNAATTPGVAGTFAGTAPGVSLIMYGIGDVLEPVGVVPVAALLWINSGLQHLLYNLDTIKPRPRVASLSLGDAAGTPYNSGSVRSCLVKALVNQDVSVVWAAGNSGGDGTVDSTSSTCKDPNPGVVCVASYDDRGTGSVRAGLSSFSSRGDVTKPAEYPDIAAPGSNITSTCAQGLQGQITCSSGAETRWAPLYGTISGTSMATPQVAGALALLYQARPDLTPPEAELLLQNTARKVETVGEYVPDPQNPDGTVHFGFGAGLLNLQAALDAVGVAKDGTAPPGAVTVIESAARTNIPGAADILSLSMEETVLDEVSGITYRLTVRDAQAFSPASGITYRVRSNVNGEAFSTQILANADGVSAAEEGAGNTAPATQVTRAGNVIEFTVPYHALGYPPLNAPIHNIRVDSAETGTGMTLDYAPAPANSAGPEADLFPGFGLPFTVTLPVDPPLFDEAQQCGLPGVTLLTDRLGDFNITGGVLIGGPELPVNLDSQDLRSLTIGQVYERGVPAKLHFTLRVASLDPLTPGSAYYASFLAPDGLLRGVRMVVSNPAAPTFITYVVAPSSGGITDGRFVSQPKPTTGELDRETGEIRFMVDPADLMIDLSVGSAPEARLLSGFNAGVVQSTNPVGTGPNASLVMDEMPDGLSRVGTLQLRANRLCGTNVAPVAALSGPQAGETDEALSFSGAGSTDADGDVLTYLFDFGDGSTVSQSSATAMHTYAAPGTYTVSLSVTDAFGAADTASLDVTITQAEEEVVPGEITARLSADRSGGEVPLLVQFDASASSYTEGGAIIAPEYTFVFGDGQQSEPQSSPTITHTYEAAGTFKAKVIVKDGSENVAVSDPVVITPTVTITVTPGNETVAQLTVDRTSGQAPLKVTFDGSRSFAADGASIVSYTFDFGDGRSVTQTTPVASHVYTRAGSFQPTLTVTDSNSEQAQAKASVQVGPPNNPPPPPAPPETPRRVGGGGALGLLLLPLLGVALYRRRRGLA